MESEHYLLCYWKHEMLMKKQSHIQKSRLYNLYIHGFSQIVKILNKCKSTVFMLIDLAWLNPLSWKISNYKYSDIISN